MEEKTKEAFFLVACRNENYAPQTESEKLILLISYT